MAHPVRLVEGAVYKQFPAFPALLSGNELVNRLPILRKHALIIESPENLVTYKETLRFIHFVWL